MTSDFGHISLSDRGDDGGLMHPIVAEATDLPLPNRRQFGGGGAGGMVEVLLSQVQTGDVAVCDRNDLFGKGFHGPGGVATTSVRLHRNTVLSP